MNTREHPESEENEQMTRENERAVFAAKMQWHYFMGDEGNRLNYPRKGCEFFDEAGGKVWKRCFDFDFNTPPNPAKNPFVSWVKYRRPGCA